MKYAVEMKSGVKTYVTSFITTGLAIENAMVDEIHRHTHTHTA
jgi:hypothetical protein